MTSVLKCIIISCVTLEIKALQLNCDTILLLEFLFYKIRKEFFQTYLYILSYSCSIVKLKIHKIHFKITLNIFRAWLFKMIMGLKTTDVHVFITISFIVPSELWYVRSTKHHLTEANAALLSLGFSSKLLTPFLHILLSAWDR